jgi:hypothetical protein
MNPRMEFDNLGTMICFHKRYNLGDKHNWDIDDFSEWINKNEKDLERIDNFIFMQSGFKTVKEYVDDCKNRIVYQVKRVDDLKSMLKLGEIK